MSKKYMEAGVNLEAGYEGVKRIKKHVERTKIKGAMDSLGAFGGAFDLSILKYKEPILVSGTDGVGTKLKLGIELDIHHTLGQDLVAMCVNDILVQGAKPLFFLDYIAIGKNDPSKIEDLVRGVSDGCILGKCALIGGETAEMPGVYEENHYDLAGFAVGVVEKSKMITGEKIESGDIIIGIKSSGIHSNGYSLVRKIIKDNDLDLRKIYEGFNKELGEVLLKPTKIYTELVEKVLEKIEVRGMCHITGGGFYENVPRVLPKGLGAQFNYKDIEILEIFKFLKKYGNLQWDEMFNIFNMGIGFMIIVRKEDVKEVLNILNGEGSVIGEVVKGVGVEIKW
ncbi:phosphoribosylformylglycinamidine cyclo-ligase [Cetobacterium ceti]|uniref:Phosphoribosylformylglycinamidine cyclo-ligase n=1 Tax=Cetobacterium ceti TaxID=180163 RepID=A0A1T4KE30_9FUSO|nr:phosphoribosylformylglycinamidine cyclo-ligase [Cetobacterium ceti]SJZ40718.1 phosphoribosylformylglycinamidine cyclo-ligase [Cetobacterium ceti]